MRNHVDTMGTLCSTLVDILAGKRKVGHTSGNVQLLTDNPGAVRVGYVDQADVLSANLSERSQLERFSDVHRAGLI